MRGIALIFLLLLSATVPAEASSAYLFEFDVSSGNAQVQVGTLHGNIAITGSWGNLTIDLGRREKVIGAVFFENCAYIAGRTGGSHFILKFSKDKGVEWVEGLRFRAKGIGAFNGLPLLFGNGLLLFDEDGRIIKGIKVRGVREIYSVYASDVLYLTGRGRGGTVIAALRDWEPIWAEKVGLRDGRVAGGPEVYLIGRIKNEIAVARIDDGRLEDVELIKMGRLTDAEVYNGSLRVAGEFRKEKGALMIEGREAYFIPKVKPTDLNEGYLAGRVFREGVLIKHDHDGGFGWLDGKRFLLSIQKVEIEREPGRVSEVPVTISVDEFSPKVKKLRAEVGALDLEVHLGKVWDESCLPRKRGEYVTGPADPDEERLEWMSKFNIVHAGNIEDPLSVQAFNYLKEHGVEAIVADDWLPGQYYYLDDQNSPFMEWVFENREWTTLNPDGPFPHCPEGCLDFYFDLANEEVVERRVEYLSENLGMYDGYFFDWGNSIFLEDPGYERIKAEYYARHPDIPYEQALSNFLSSLTVSIVIDNQGFRNPEWLLPVIDYDMSESYVTTDAPTHRRIYVIGYGWRNMARTVYHPLGRFEDTIYYLDMLRELDEEYGGGDFKGTILMNYAAPEFIRVGHGRYRAEVPRRAIYLGMAAGLLTDHISFTEVPWDHRLEMCDAYFYDLGDPLSQRSRTGSLFLRFFENGFVLAGDIRKKGWFKVESPYLPPNTPVYDALARRWYYTQEGYVWVFLDGGNPIGRVFIYGKG